MRSIDRYTLMLSVILLITGHINGSDVKSSAPPAKDYRYVVCTDMTHDDDNSLIRLLHYANEIDIEAIIITDQGPESIRIPDTRI